MTWLDALDAFNGHSHIGRYRQLCDSLDIEIREAWREKIVRMASGEPEPQPVQLDPIPDAIPPRSGCCGGNPYGG